MCALKTSGVNRQGRARARNKQSITLTLYTTHVRQSYGALVSGFILTGTAYSYSDTSFATQGATLI